MTTRSRTAIAVVLLGLLLLVPPAAAQDRYLIDTGPLRVRDQFLLGMGFLAFDPATADVLTEGEWQADLIATATNHFARSEGVAALIESRTQRVEVTLDQLRSVEPVNGERGAFFVDGEVYRTILALRRGVGRGIQLELVLPVLSFQGGVVDSLVEQFHTAFAFDQEGRQGVLRNNFTIYARNGETELFLTDQPSLTLGDAVVGARFRLRPDGLDPDLHLAVETLLKLPTGGEEPIASSGSADLGVNLLATRYFSRQCLHASLGILALGPSDRLELGSQVLLSGMLGYEAALSESTSWLIQTTVAQTPFEDLGLDGLNQPSIQATVGLKRVVREGVLVVGITENFGSFNNTPDVGFHFGWTHTFRGPGLSN